MPNLTNRSNIILFETIQRTFLIYLDCFRPLIVSEPLVIWFIRL